MRTKTRDQTKVQEVAHEIMGRVKVGDLENLITREERLCVLSEIEPGYSALEKESNNIHAQLLKRLKNKQDREALNRYSDIQVQLFSAESTCGFHLGFAAALQLLGSESWKKRSSQQRISEK